MNIVAFLQNKRPVYVLIEACVINFLKELTTTVNAVCFVALSRVATIIIHCSEIL